MKYNPIFLAITLFLSSCVSTIKVGTVADGQFKRVDHKNYSLGEPLRAYVGDQMILRKAYETYVKPDTMKVENDFVLSGGLGTTSLKLQASRGDKFRIAGINEKGNYVLAIPGSHLMFGVAEDGSWDNTVMSSSAWTSPIGSGGQYKMAPPNTRFTLVSSSKPVSEAGYVNHELIFTGLGANGITILYREYTFENMARSAFSQELIYPEDSEQIRFRNYRIRVIEVNPAEIKFSVEEE